MFLKIMPMTDVTQILSQIEHGDPSAAEQLLPLVYEELRRLAAAKLANERPGQTLQATALVHDAYLRLVDVDQVQRWNSRGHFFGAAAEAMRRILVESARRKRAIKRGAEQIHELQETDVLHDHAAVRLVHAPQVGEHVDALGARVEDAAQRLQMADLGDRSRHPVRRGYARFGSSRLTAGQRRRKIGAMSEPLLTTEDLGRLAEVSPIAARQTKRTVHRATLARDVAEHARFELVNARRGLASDDGAEAREAFLAKRKPEFRGR